jgi:hypothetical protein
MNTEAILSELWAQRDRIDLAIAALDSRTTRSRQKRTGTRHMSAAARKRIGEAKRKWWAERKKSGKA